MENDNWADGLLLLLLLDGLLVISRSSSFTELDGLPCWLLVSVILSAKLGLLGQLLFGLDSSPI